MRCKLLDNLKEKIKTHEGYSDKPYLCSQGKWTVGYGYNYEDRGFDTESITEVLNHGFTKKLADRLLTSDIKDCIVSAEKIINGYEALNDARKAVMIDMIYQLGVFRFLKFKRMLLSVKNENILNCAKEMINSRWYNQSGKRSRLNVLQILTGEWQDIEKAYNDKNYIKNAELEIKQILEV
mgnify:CR=1 FL=1